jgi:hypothetical protein
MLKKIILLLLVFHSKTTFSQDISIVAGILESKLLRDPTSISVNRYTLGYFLGINKRTEINQNHLINLGLNFSQRRIQTNTFGLKTASFFSLPTSFQVNLKKGYCIESGPQVDYYFYTNHPFPFSRFNILGNLGVKKKLNKELFLGLRYSHSMINSYPDKDIFSKFSIFNFYIEKSILKK